MQQLSDFLRRSAALRFVWGARDCVLWAGEWAEARRGVFPGARFKGTYATAIECMRLVEAEGGFLALVERECAAAGIAAIEVKDAVAGDVVAIEGVGMMFSHALGIRTERHVAFKSLGRGVDMIDAAPIRAWRI